MNTPLFLIKLLYRPIIRPFLKIIVESTENEFDDSLVSVADKVL